MVAHWPWRVTHQAGGGRLPPIGGRHSRTLHGGGGLRTRCAETNFPAGINQAQQAAASAQQNCCYVSSLV